MMIKRPHPTVQIPCWDDPTASINLSSSPYFAGAHSPPPASSDYSPSSFSALHRYLPSNDVDKTSYEFDSDDAEFDSFSCDEFRMYEFKVRRCARGRSHDWTECPFAHPGEKARRRDPRLYNYSGIACPDFRKGGCKRGDSCEFAHGVFECWLHPTRYRTQPCKDGARCPRRVCFFAHSPDQLRLLPDSPPPSRLGESPPSLSELVGGVGGLQIGSGKVRSCSWRVQLSPRSPANGSGFGPGLSLPSTPNRVRFFDSWNLSLEEEPAMERVESGKNLRAAMYAKLKRENTLDRAEPASPAPDFGWVSELVK